MKVDTPWLSMKAASGQPVQLLPAVWDGLGGRDKSGMKKTAATWPPFFIHR
jgi:hypothetical protein